MSDFIAYSVGICFMSVCVLKEMDRDELEQKANEEYPSGVMPWTISDEEFRSGDSNPCLCDKYPQERIHYLLNC